MNTVQGGRVDVTKGKHLVCDRGYWGHLDASPPPTTRNELNFGCSSLKILKKTCRIWSEMSIDRPVKWILKQDTWTDRMVVVGGVKRPREARAGQPYTRQTLHRSTLHKADPTQVSPTQGWCYTGQPYTRLSLHRSTLQLVFYSMYVLVSAVFIFRR